MTEHHDPETCPICDKIRMQQWIHTMSNMCAIEAVNPVAEGHLIIAPFAHIDASDDYTPAVLGQLSSYAVIVSRVQKMRQYNLILACGPDASQSTPHLYLHLIPRKRGDKLALPWSRARTAKTEE